MLNPELRLQRFEVAAMSRTVSEAAVTLGVRPFVVNNALRSLEAVTRGLLLERSALNEPHRLTPLGHRLLRQLG